MTLRRARTKAFEADPQFEFEFYLTEKLGGMTVAELRERMSADEFLYWEVYFGRKAQRIELERLKAKGGETSG